MNRYECRTGSTGNTTVSERKVIQGFSREHCSQESIERSERTFGSLQGPAGAVLAVNVFVGFGDVSDFEVVGIPV